MLILNISFFYKIKYIRACKYYGKYSNFPVQFFSLQFRTKMDRWI